MNLPSKAVAVVHRSDGSGTTFLFTTYLSRTSPDWKDKVGADTSVEWPVGIGAKGNEGVADMAKQTDGAIGYVEYAYAKQNKMTYTKMVTDGQGRRARLAFQAAAASADWAKSPGYYVILTNQPGADSWPITGASFILIYKQPDDPAAVKTAFEFFDWAYKTAATWPKSSTTCRSPTMSSGWSRTPGGAASRRRRQGHLLIALPI